MIKLVLVDLSGTLHVGKTAIPGTVQAVERLDKWARSNGATYRFLSNTTKESKSKLHSTLKRMGFELVSLDRMITPLQVAGDEIRSLGAKNPVCFLSETAIPELGISPSPSEPFDSVVVGLSPEDFHYSKLNQAFRLLKDKEVPFISMHKGRYFKDEDGGLSLGPGPFVKALEDASGKVSTIVGKPSPKFFEIAVNQAENELKEKLPVESILMIGDDLRDDILGAKSLGFKTILVRTGKFRPEDASLADLCLDSFSSAVDWLEKNHSSSKHSGL